VGDGPLGEAEGARAPAQMGAPRTKGTRSRSALGTSGAMPARPTVRTWPPQKEGRFEAPGDLDAARLHTCYQLIMMAVYVCGAAGGRMG
jgi:hypothetical protein